MFFLKRLKTAALMTELSIFDIRIISPVKRLLYTAIPAILRQKEIPGQVKNNESLCASSRDIFLSLKSLTAALREILYPPVRPHSTASIQLPDKPNDLKNTVCSFRLVLSLSPEFRKKYETVKTGNKAGTVTFNIIFIADVIPSDISLELKEIIRTQKIDIIENGTDNP